MNRQAPAATHSRREFLGHSGSGLAAAILLGTAPRVLFAQDRTGNRRPVVGSGAHTFEVEHDWGRLPEGCRLGNTHGICQDSQGRIYVKHTVGAGSRLEDALLVFDSDGAFVRSWGAEYRGGAHGLHLQREGDGEFLYLADPARNLFAKHTLDGEKLWQRTCPDASGLYDKPGDFRPTNIAVAPTGEIFVADGYGKSWIHVYDSRGEYQRSFGGPGAERGQLRCPHGIWCDLRSGKPRLLIADRSNRRLQYFSLDGRTTGFVTDEMRAPCHFDTRGSELLIPDLEGRVTLLDGQDRLITHLGDGWSDQGHALRDKPREQFIPGRFIAPHAAIFDRAGDIFVVEWVEVGRITRLHRVNA